MSRVSARIDCCQIVKFATVGVKSGGAMAAPASPGGILAGALWCECSVVCDCSAGDILLLRDSTCSPLSLTAHFPRTSRADAKRALEELPRALLQRLGTAGVLALALAGSVPVTYSFKILLERNLMGTKYRKLLFWRSAQTPPASFEPHRTDEVGAVWSKIQEEASASVDRRLLRPDALRALQRVPSGKGTW